MGVDFLKHLKTDMISIEYKFYGITEFDNVIQEVVCLIPTTNGKGGKYQEGLYIKKCYRLMLNPGVAE